MEFKLIAMKRINIICVIVILLITSVQCRTNLKSQYGLVKKSPPDLPNVQLKIINDSTGELIDSSAKSSQLFRFKRWKRNFLVINSTEDNDLKLLKVGDTIVHYRKELIIYNERLKITFKE